MEESCREINHMLDLRRFMEESCRELNHMLKMKKVQFYIIGLLLICAMMSGCGLFSKTKRRCKPCVSGSILIPSDQRTINWRWG